jgi:multidrug transporter EmrE-like cation transporter
MSRLRQFTGLLAQLESSSVIVFVLISTNVVFNIIANAAFKLSASSSGWRGFLTWQVVGNLAGFATVLTLTGLLRYIPLHVAYPVTMGLAILGVQIVAAHMFFHEPITLVQWLGTLLVAVGIILITSR